MWFKAGFINVKSEILLIPFCAQLLRRVMNGFWAPLGFFSPFFLANGGFLDVLFRDSKLTMLLSESLGNINCQTTMIAHISDSPANYMETLTTVQLASRIHRMRKKKNKVHKGYSSKPQRSLYSREEIKY